MRLFQRSIALLLSLLMLLALVSCETSTERSEISNHVDPKAVEAYESAIAAYESADSYELSFIIKTKKQVGTETFEDHLSGSAKYLVIAGEEPQALVETHHILGLEEFDTTESYKNGVTTYSFSDQQYAYQCKESFEEFSQRQTAVKLLDPAHYENVVFSPEDPQQILFSAAVSPEEWLPGLSEDYGCLDFHAEGRVTLAEGQVAQLSYNVTYTRGAALYSTAYTITPKAVKIDRKDLTHDLSKKYPESLRDITLPYTLRCAITILNRHEQGMVRIHDEFFRQGGGKTLLEELLVFTCLDENEMPAMLATETSIQISPSGQQTTETVRRKQTRGQYAIAENGEGFSETQVDAEFARLSKHRELQSVEFPAYGQFEKVTVKKFGSFVLLEGDLNYSASRSCFSRAGELESGDSSLYEDAVPRSATCKIAIDLDTGFLTAAQILTVATTDKSSTDVFAFMRDLYVEPGSHGSYQTIFEMPYPDQEPPAEKKATPLFYKVTDEEGHTAYLLGTIHAGDNRTAYLPQSIYDAFNSSDALAVESNLLDFEERMETDAELSAAYSNSMFFADGTTMESYLRYPDLYHRTQRLLFAMGYGLYAEHMKPSAAVSVIDSWYSGLFPQLTSDKGVDMRLLQLADEDGKKIYEIEKPKDHFNALTDYSKDTQIQMLKEALDMKKSDAMHSGLYLYELWCQGDEKTLREAVTPILPEDATSEERAYYEEYMDKMITKRDKVMVKGIQSYLASGETVFVAVGLAHVIGEGGIVDQLKEAGYTVTLVQ